MGLTSAKSGIIVKNNKSFLQLIIEQIRHLNKKYHCSVPLILMNSLNTDEETKDTIRDIADVEILCFNQEYYPRLDAMTLMPLAQESDSPPQYWYPPGHGNVYDSLYSSGMLKKLLGRGINIIFISNADNLGAILDINLAASLYNSDADVLIEVTNKTARDIKGGAIIQYKQGSEIHYKDLEIAQVPQEHLLDFQAFPHFNTGNLWVKLSFLKSAIETNQLNLDVIKNFKNVEGKRILQLETASGSIVSSTNRVLVVNVPRSRFIPTKTCSDLAVIMSDCYLWDEQEGRLQQNAQLETIPQLSLSEEYTSLRGLLARFHPVPSLVNLQSLSIKGDVRFSRGVILKGKVEIVAESGKTLIVPDNAVLDNVHVAGSLFISAL